MPSCTSPRASTSTLPISRVKSRAIASLRSARNCPRGRESRRVWAPVSPASRRTPAAPPRQHARHRPHRSAGNGRAAHLSPGRDSRWCVHPRPLPTPRRCNWHTSVSPPDRRHSDRSFDAHDPPEQQPWRARTRSPILTCASVRLTEECGHKREWTRGAPPRSYSPAPRPSRSTAPAAHADAPPPGRRLPRAGSVDRLGENADREMPQQFDE